MYVERQGTNLDQKVKELENRIEMLENAIKELKSDKPRMGLNLERHQIRQYA